MRFGIRLGPFWVSTSTRSRRRRISSRDTRGSGEILGAIVGGIVVTVLAAAWPLIFFHRPHGWGYAWHAEIYWLAGVAATLYFARKFAALRMRRRLAKRQAAWIPVTGTVFWQGSDPEFKLVLSADDGRTYVIPVTKGNQLLTFRTGDRISGRWDPERKFMHEVRHLPG